jgi:RNA polymerase sigma factor (sigma-70 family)
MQEQHFLGWIVKAIDHTLRDRARWFGARKRTAAETDIGSQLLDPGAAAPSTDAQRAEDLAALCTAMERLSPRDRELILLTRIEGRTAAEAGAVLGLAEETAQRAVTRALVRLAAHMR